MFPLSELLSKLSEHVRSGTYEQFETESIELKPVPPTGKEWSEIKKSIAAFLNTRGGDVILGIKEEKNGPARKFHLTGWRESDEGHIRELEKAFADEDGHPLNVQGLLSSRIVPFLDSRILVISVSELSAEKKYAFFERVAYRRVLTGDVKIEQQALATQRQFRLDAMESLELRIVPNTSTEDIDLEKLNAYLYELNRPTAIETIKANIEDSRSFLERRSFLVQNQLTILGSLVCIRHPGDRLGFRSHLHCYIDASPAEQRESESIIVHDKQDYIDNILPLMESGYNYLLRNVHMGIRADQGGRTKAQIPLSLLRESINNALAHRDYTINRQVIVAIEPNRQISIQNPGMIPAKLRMESTRTDTPIRRIIPEAKPTNPKLADVLRVFRKWEGRGIGMATLVKMCLQNEIDLPYYVLKTEEVVLVLREGRLLDERIERWLDSFDEWIDTQMQGLTLATDQKLILAYLMKSEWDNKRNRYTILLSHQNNHFDALNVLIEKKVILLHDDSPPNYPNYIVNPILMKQDYLNELRALFGDVIGELNQTDTAILNLAYRLSQFSKEKRLSAKRLSYSLWFDRETNTETNDLKAFNNFDRKIRFAVNRLWKSGLLVKEEGKRAAYLLNSHYLSTRLA